MKIEVIQNVLKLNDELAEQNRRRLRAAGLPCIDLMGGPGCGKTALLEATLSALHDKLHIGICVGDLATTRDAERLYALTDQVVQINTGKSCHLEAHQIGQALDRFDLDRLDLLIIENVGNLICPVGFDLGQNAKVGMFSLSEGDDKAVKHPHIVCASDLLLLNKIDLAPYLPFDRVRFRDEVERLHPGVELVELSAKDRDGGFLRWIQWLSAHTRGAEHESADLSSSR
jgi:hydrogenase nickel incorporation protein HypB